MSRHHTPWRALRRSGAAVALAGLASVVALAPAHAAGASPDAARSAAPVPEKITHPLLDHMGAGLARRAAAAVAPAVTPAATPAATPEVAGLKGIDVSAYQGSVNWTAAKNDGVKFAYIKATEGTHYVNPDFAQQYDGSYGKNIVRGAYHFAIPNNSGGAAQADYFVKHGGGWSKDGLTLPGALDIEYNPYGAECYGLSQSAMKSWVKAFVDEYHSKTGRWAVVYSTADWWKTCTGDDTALVNDDPLWIADYGVSAPAMPAGWGVYTFWQYGDSGTFGDQDTFNGTAARLTALANNTA